MFLVSFIYLIRTNNLNLGRQLHFITCKLDAFFNPRFRYLHIIYSHSHYMSDNILQTSWFHENKGLVGVKTYLFLSFIRIKP